MHKPGPKGFHTSPHSHTYHELGVVVSGSCTWTLNARKKLHLKNGEALLLPPGTIHHEDINPESKGRVVWVGFEMEHQELTRISEKKITIRAPEQMETLLDWIEREWNTPNTDGRTYAMHALEMLLILLQRSVSTARRQAYKEPVALNERQSRIVQSARAYFEENTAMPRSVEQIARYHSLSATHFSALFRKALGIAPREFVQRLRIRETGKLLAESDLPLKEIARKFGYVDAAHFCRHFRRETGMTPRQYRLSKIKRG